MLWFNRKKKSTEEATHDTRVEVVVHQQATQDVVDEAIKSNDKLLDALQPNHITLRLYVAAGGRIQKGAK